MIPYFVDGDIVTVSAVNRVLAALGLDLADTGDVLSDIWNAIAHECGLPDTRADSGYWYTAPGWNRAVDAANERTLGDG